MARTKKPKVDDSSTDLNDADEIKMKHSLKNAGFNLLELMLGFSLGLLLILGFFSLYISLKSNYLLIQAYSRIQENERFIFQIISQFRMAGLAICESKDNPVIMPPVIGYTSENLPNDLEGQVKWGTDVITVSSCFSNLSGAAGSVSKTSYFIGDSHRKNSVGKEIFSLYEKVDNQDRAELVEGVDDMHITYELNQSDSSHFVSADTVQDWSQVSGVHLEILLNSVEPILKESQPYYFNSEKVLSHDHLLYQSLDYVVALREKM